MTQAYSTIVADPPWFFDDALPGVTRGASKNYACMPTSDICRLASYDERCLQIMDHDVAKDAALFFWRVASMQQDALDVVRSWGFTIKSELVWLKKTRNGKRWFGMGRTVRAEHEVCLIATRGRPEILNHAVRSTFVTEQGPTYAGPPGVMDVEGFSHPVGRHSEKPEVFYDIVESLVGGPYLELFARRQRPGWTCTGLESGAV